jgi:hypothetical protein
MFYQNQRGLLESAEILGGGENLHLVEFQVLFRNEERHFLIESMD